ncbi:hypothetical protein Glove_567g10 [Diversispora epigaea]|uniref:Uncharacterized protein n=1 Tax=Diversispora epigaea TaxID=1348612 RepID=A0A397GCF7_9GLOM|nr:hypothetical protein Glove_567g10 [Diversispora epigaea]
MVTSIALFTPVHPPSIVTLKPRRVNLAIITDIIRELFDAKRNLKKKIMNSVVKESVHVTAHIKGLQTFLQPSVPSGTKSTSPEIQKKDTCHVISDSDYDEDTNGDDHVSDNESSPPQEIYMKDPEYFDKLAEKVDLSCIGIEEGPMPVCLKSGISVVNNWDDFDILEFFNSLRDSLPKKSPEIHPQYWGILDLTGQHKPTKKMFITKWDELINNFQQDIAWKMVELDQSEIELFDNIEDPKTQQKTQILYAHLTILKSYLKYIKLPINERELMIHIVVPAFRIGVDPNQEKFRKLWCEQQLVASQEICRINQDPNDDRASIRQKTNLIIVLPTGPPLEGFICEVSGGLPAGCSKKIWTDKLKIMVGMRDMINRIIKTFPGLLPEDYMKIVVFGCQVIEIFLKDDCQQEYPFWITGLQMNLYAMDLRKYGIYRFGIIDKVFLPASTQELPAYEAVHVMLRSLEHRLSELADYCSDLKVKHSKLR